MTKTELFIYQAITGDSVVLKFEKARCALEDGLARVEDIVPQSIGCQVIFMCFCFSHRGKSSLFFFFFPFGWLRT